MTPYATYQHSPTRLLWKGGTWRSYVAWVPFVKEEYIIPCLWKSCEFHATYISIFPLAVITFLLCYFVVYQVFYSNESACVSRWHGSLLYFCWYCACHVLLAIYNWLEGSSVSSLGLLLLDDTSCLSLFFLRSVRDNNQLSFKYGLVFLTFLLCYF